MSTDEEEIKQKMAEYSRFVSEKLRPEMDAAQNAVDTTRDEMAGYQELGIRLAELQDKKTKEIATMVDLGHGTVFCNAVARVDGTLYVHIGMGFHAELTIPEARQFVLQRIAFLQNHVLPGRKKTLKDISDHVSSATTILAQLNRELQRSTQR